jgi:hypothetical protein
VLVLQRFESFLFTPAIILGIPLKAGLKQGVAKDQAVHRTGWIVFLRPKWRKTKAHPCFKPCTCNRVQSTRFVWQEIKRSGAMTTLDPPGNFAYIAILKKKP